MAEETVFSSLASRAELWTNSVLSWWDAPIFGHGAGSFEWAYGEHRASHTALFDQTILTTPSVGPGAAHNEVLQTLVEFGLVGTLLAAIFLWRVCRGREDIARERQWPHAMLWVAVPMALIGFPLQNPASALLIVIGLAAMCRA